MLNLNFTKMKKVVSSIVLAFSFLLVTNLSVAQCGGTETKSKSAKADCHSEAAKIAAVKFHADYCGACKKLEPKITELKGKFHDEVVFVKFDFTNDDSKAKTETLAKDQGLNDVLASNKGTGYIVLYDLKHKKVVGKLNSSQSVAEMEKEIKTYL